MIQIFSAAICPYAQRTRALLTHLDIPFEVQEVDLSHRDPELLRLSPTGRVPFLRDGDLVLYESQVINDYLAEINNWNEAYASNPILRARQKLAMKQWDSIVLPAFYQSLKKSSILDDDTRSNIEKELDFMAGTAEQMGEDINNLVAFHIAPFWARMDWLREYSPIANLIDTRPHLKSWCDATVALKAVQETLPEKEWAIKRYEEHYVNTEIQT